MSNFVAFIAFSAVVHWPGGVRVAQTNCFLVCFPFVCIGVDLPELPKSVVFLLRFPSMFIGLEVYELPKCTVCIAFPSVVIGLGVSELPKWVAFIEFSIGGYGSGAG